MISFRRLTRLKYPFYQINSQSAVLCTYVSEHYKVDSKELRNVISLLKTDIRAHENGDVVCKVCNLCNKGNKTNLDNLWKLHIRPNGSYHCFRCAATDSNSGKGSWFQLRKLAGGKDDLTSVTSSSLSTSNVYPENKFLNMNGQFPQRQQSQMEVDETKQYETKKKDPVIPDQREVFGFTTALFPMKKKQSGDVFNEDAVKVQNYLISERGLKESVLKRYGVGMALQQFPDESGTWVDTICVTFPWMMENPSFYSETIKSDTLKSVEDETEEVADAAVVKRIKRNKDKPYIVQRVKYRALKTKGMQRILPKGGSWGFFGWHTVRESHKEIIITEGEYDAMAVAQALSQLSDEHPLRHVPSISLPNGCNSLPIELLQCLERFEKIYLWMDNDKSGHDGAEKFTRKLGINRCFIVRPDSTSKNPPKDANDALRQNDDIPKLLTSAKQLSHQKLITFSDIRDEAISALRRQVNRREGSQTPSLPKLSTICKGFRRGELVVFTGPTGAGKTTILSQLSLDFAKQGVPTLWGSFEITNVRLTQKMLKQYAGKEVRDLENIKLEKLCDDFESLPLKFMNFHGGSDINEIVDAMDFAVYRDDIQHIILDNLQFMMTRNRRGNFDKFDAQDMAIDTFRKFATEKNVNIILVVHPRKEEETKELSISSVFGTAKATQEADLVLILQRNSLGKSSLDVKKNRYDGDLGKCELLFNENQGCFREN